ncbi:oxidoreductase [Agaricicola taiwanensis]|uniref:Oxidoreductase n=1 Tax=Agaricicola taiwanensis TaxID=591372 RepID=A0A8J2YFA9_9RHOB|nr:aldo/keto reductase [Agaricicola taiwanensis]GGE41299.1 oxidoreductase [Agaricicola taiwanensis]
MEPPPLPTRALPRTGLHIPIIGLGGAALGGMHGVVTEEETRATLTDAWGSGFRYFDTAPLYGHGLGELRLGAALRDRPKGGYVLSTKVGWRMTPLAPAEETPPNGNLPFGRHIDYSFDGTLRSVEDSLMRLGLDRLDLVFVHDVDPYNHGSDYPARFTEAVDGALPALRRLREEGVIGAIGIGVNNCDVCRDFLEKADLDCFLLAGRYSLLDREAEITLLPECERRGVGVIIGAPFNTGILAKGSTGKFNHGSEIPPHILARVEAMTSACADHGVSLMAAALQFPLRHPTVISVLPGPRSRQQLQGIAVAARTQIPEALWAEMDAIRSTSPAPM